MKLSHALMRGAGRIPPDFLELVGSTTGSSGSSGGSSYTAPIPTHELGDLLVVFLQQTGGGSSQSWTSGWTRQGNLNYSGEGNSCGVFTKIAESSSEVFTATFSDTLRRRTSVALTFRSKTGRVPKFEFLYSALGEDSFPEVTPSAGLQKYTWLPSFAAKRNGGSIGTLTMPYGYSNIRSPAVGATNLYGRLVVGLKSTQATSETPGTMQAIGGSDYHVTLVAAVWEEEE